MSKPKVIKEFEKLDEQIKLQIKLNYPYGFEKHLITFKNHKKHLISALPYETEDRHFLVKMTREKAQAIISNDEDYNDNGILKEEAKSNIQAQIQEHISKLEEVKVVDEPSGD